MPSPSLSRLYRSDRRRGLALLVTIVLLAFLVLIVAALSSLVRVETQIAVNTDSVAQARQNALVGVNMALGQLQEHAGIDKRVTARSDITSGAIHNSYLTGVWDDSGNLVTWLVNGNEEQTAGNPPYVTPDYATTSKTNAASRILDPTDDSNAENPISSSLVDDSNPPATAAAANPRFGPGHVYLVSGRVNALNENVGSVDVRSNASVQAGYKDGIAERIILRKSPIVVDGGSVPGRAPGSQVQIGSYAYWVADNGIRASLGSGNRAATGLNVFPNDPATDLLNYDDSSATPAGMDYNQHDNLGFSKGTAAADESYLARKFLNSLQIQATRTDLVLWDKTNDIFSPANRRSFYALLAHPENSAFFSELDSVDQLTQLPVLRDYTVASVIPNVSGVPTITAQVADYQKDIRDRLRQRFHDITPKSRGVLTDMVNGGLRKDLTFEAANGFPNTAAAFQPGVKTFLDFWRSGAVSTLGNSAMDRLALSSDIVPPPAAAFAAGAPADTAYYAVVPVASEFKFLMNLSVDSSGALQVSVAGKLELWNPYNAPLKEPVGNLYAVIPVGGSKTYLSDFDVNDGTTPARSVNIQQTFQGSNTYTSGGEVYMYFLLDTTGPKEWEPGEIKVWDFNSAARPARDSGGAAISGMTSGASLQTMLSSSSSAGELNVTIQMGNAPAGSAPLFAATGIPYDAPTGPGDTWCFHFRLSDYMDYDSGAQDWLRNANPIGPVVRYAKIGSVEVLKPYPVNVETNFDSENQVLYNPASVIPPMDVVLFDLPRQEITSIGALQHLAFSPSGGSSNSRAYRLGGRGPDVVNRLFDTHFISTVPRRDASADGATPPPEAWLPVLNRPLANTALRVFDPAAAQNTPHKDLMKVVVGGVTTGLQSERAAEFLLIEDAFNINSTSVAAWMGVLGGALPSLADPNVAAPDGDDYIWPSPATADSELKANWRYRDGTNATAVPLANVFFRLPHTATNLEDNYTTVRDDLDSGTRETRIRAAFRLGLREFTRADIEGLATAVVARLKANGKPFTSVSAFVDSGILEDAIAAAGLNTKSSNDIPPLSPAYLTQGDILQLIAPRLVARSDTFTVRSYGDVVDPVTGEVRARAWVEATIQRLPVKHRTADNAADNMLATGSGAGNFGRQFKVVGLRWLSPDEI